MQPAEFSLLAARRDSGQLPLTLEELKAAPAPLNGKRPGN